MEHTGKNLGLTSIDNSLSTLLSAHIGESTSSTDRVRLDLLKKLSSFTNTNGSNRKTGQISTRRKLILAIFICVLIVSISFGSFIYLGITYPDSAQISPGVYVPSGAIVGKMNVGVSGSYITPKNGSCLYFIEVDRALKLYAWMDVTFYVGIYIAHDGIPIDKESEQRELLRLNDLGYHIGYAEAWEYKNPDEKIKYNYIAGYFTADELRNFHANDDYGYSFYFAVNGDGAPVDGGDGIIIEFNGTGFN